MPFPYNAVPLPCRSAKGLDCDFPIRFTQCVPCLIHTYHAVPMPFPCHATNMPLTAGSWHGRGMLTSCELNVSDLPAVGFFLLPRGVPGSLLSEAGEWQGRGMVCFNPPCHCQF